MKTKPVSFWTRLKEISRFFQGRDQVHKTLHRLVRRLEKADIPYAILGGMAVYFHGHQQATGDVDILLTAEGLAAFRERFVPKKYNAAPQCSRRFIDRKNDVQIDVVVTGLFPRNGKPGPIAFPDPSEVSETIDNIKVVDLVTLIRLKLASRRYQDLADVGALMRAKNLDETFMDRLHPSLHGDCMKCLEENRREAEYEAING